RAFHQRCVFLVGAAVRRQVELVERHPDRRGLLLEKLDPHAVVADAVELAGHRRQERHDLIPRAPAQFVERHRAVLTATPRKDHFFSVGHCARSRQRETPALTLHLPAPPGMVRSTTSPTITRAPVATGSTAGEVGILISPSKASVSSPAGGASFPSMSFALATAAPVRVMVVVGA